MELIACQYGKSKTFPLPFVTYGSTDYLSGVTLAVGDVQISKDGGAFANIATLPTILGRWMIITLSATEMQAEYIAVQIIDQTATKVFEDTGAILTTTNRAWQRELFALVESQRGSHTARELIYWDPINGDDSYGGLTVDEPKLTYNFGLAGGVHSLLTDSNHQGIIIMPGQSGGVTTINEYIEIDTRYTFLRGMGRDIFINATHNKTYAILASAEGIELSGFRVNTKLTGSQKGIGLSGGFARLHDVWVDYSRGSGIVIDNSSNNVLYNFTVEDAAQGGSGHAVHILGDTLETVRNIIGSGKIFNNGDGGATDGIRIDGIYCSNNFIVGGETSLLIHENTGYGINEVNGADSTIVSGPTIHIGHNTLGDSNITGTLSIIENVSQWATETAQEAMQTSIDAIPTTPVTIVSGVNAVDTDYAEDGSTIQIVQGDTISRAFTLTGDYTSNRLFFGAKSDADDTTYAMAVREVTGHTYSASTGKTSVSVPFSSTDTDISLQVYKAEIVARDSDGLSNEFTPLKVNVEIVEQIID